MEKPIVLRNITCYVEKTDTIFIVGFSIKIPDCEEQIGISIDQLSELSRIYSTQMYEKYKDYSYSCNNSHACDFRITNDNDFVINKDRYPEYFDDKVMKTKYTTDVFRFIYNKIYVFCKHMNGKSDQYNRELEILTKSSNEAERIFYSHFDEYKNIFIDDFLRSILSAEDYLKISNCSSVTIKCLGNGRYKITEKNI